jgi:hypothetical protein
MNKYVLFLLLLTSCFSWHENTGLVQSVSPRKQKHQIASLQKKLEQARSTCDKAHLEVEEIQKQVYTARLNFIRSQVDKYEKKVEEARKNPQRWMSFKPSDPSGLFLTEREQLHQIIQEGPSSASFEAQAALDHILSLITHLSDL